MLLQKEYLLFWMARIMIPTVLQGTWIDPVLMQTLLPLAFLHRLLGPLLARWAPTPQVDVLGATPRVSVKSGLGT